MEYKQLQEVNFEDNINERVFVTFLAKEVSVAPQKNGQKFISITMKQKDLEINAKLFGASQGDIDMIKPGILYNAAIDIKPYAQSKTGWACTIYNIEPYSGSELNINMFTEWADDMDDAHETIRLALEIISESDYRDLVYPILVEYWNKFCYWTAASGMHHNILGGLLVHTAEVIDQCGLLADYWCNKYSPSFVDKPLLLSAALLHDLCKIDELNVDVASGTTEYSVHSSLSTHIMDIISRVDVQAYKICFGRQYDSIDELEGKTKSEDKIKEEQEELALLKHCLAAHHGKKEYGSPIEPTIPEAVILNYADELSATMFRFNKNFKQMKPATSTHVWTGNGVLVTYKDSSKIY